MSSPAKSNSSSSSGSNDSGSSDVSTNYASSSSSSKSNGSRTRSSQRLPNSGDSGFVTREADNAESNVSSTSSSSSEFKTAADLATNSSETSSNGSNSTKRSRKNPFPKRRLSAIDQINHLQRTTELVIPRAPFQRIVREIMRQINPDLLIQKLACEALQESAEMYMVQTFEDALLLTHHRRCVTVEAKDLKLVQRLQKPESRYQFAAETNKDVNGVNEDKDTNTEESEANEKTSENGDDE